MKKKLLALPLILTAFVGTPAAHAQGVRVCTIDNGATGRTNTMTFTPTSVIGGNWTWSFTGRQCTGAPGAPANQTISGIYTGHPCVAMVLFGSTILDTPIGVLTGGVAGAGAGVTHAGPGTGILALESVHVLDYQPRCSPTQVTTVVPVTANVTTVQVHVTP